MSNAGPSANLPFTDRMVAILPPAGAISLIIAVAAHWAGRQDSLLLYLLAACFLLAALLLGMAHMLGRGMRTTAELGFKRRRDVWPYMSYYRGYAWKTVTLLYGAILVDMYTSSRGAHISGTELLAVGIALSAAITGAVTRRWPADGG